MAMLRRLGRLAGTLLDDQLARGRARESSDMTRQRQEEVYKQGLLDKMAANLGPMLQQRKMKLENIEGLDQFPPELQQTLRTYAAGAPSDEMVSSGVMGGVSKDIGAAKTPEDLGSLSGRFEQARTGMHAQNTPINLNDVQNLGQTFNAQADVLGNAAATKQEQAAADERMKHPTLRPGITAVGANGIPGNSFVYDSKLGKMRPANPGEDTTDVDWKNSQPQWNNGQPANPPLDQTRLEREYRNVLMREYSSRAGSLGIEEGKINQATHLKAIFDQSFDKRTGTYNIPRPLMNEIALGLARMTSQTGNVGVELMHELKQSTASGDLASALTYITGEPINGSTQDVIKMFKESIDRQAHAAVQNRQHLFNGMKALAPTDLDPARQEAIDKGFFGALNYYDQGAPGSGGSGDGWTTLPGGVRVRKKQ